MSYLKYYLLDFLHMHLYKLKPMLNKNKLRQNLN